MLPGFMLAAKTCESAAVGHRELNPVLCEDLESWDWRGGRETQEGGDICIHTSDSSVYMYTYICGIQQKLTQHCGTIIRQLNKHAKN